MYFSEIINSPDPADESGGAVGSGGLPEAEPGAAEGVGLPEAEPVAAGGIEAMDQTKECTDAK
jgi:hypothetical protein